MSRTASAFTPKTRAVRKRDEFLTAMAEDLAEWMSRLFPDLASDLKGDNFFDKIADGTLLCHYATKLHERMAESSSGSRGQQRLKGVRVAGINAFLPSNPPRYHLQRHTGRNRAVGSFWARENISSFLKWCRAVGFPDSVLFETEDLVSRKHLRSVIICILELARLGGNFGMAVPEIVHLEEQIDAELTAERRSIFERKEEAKLSTPKNISPIFGKSYLDKVKVKGKSYFHLKNDIFFESADRLVTVQNILAECTCQPPFSMVRVSEGRYLLGDKSTPIFVRVMVRVDDSWDTLNHFLQQYDDCRKVSPPDQSTDNWTDDTSPLDSPKEFTSQLLDTESDDIKPTLTGQSPVNRTTVPLQMEMPNEFRSQVLGQEPDALKPTPTGQNLVNPTTVTLQMKPPNEFTSQESDVEPDDFKLTPTGRSLVNPTTVTLQMKPPNEFTSQESDVEPDDFKPTPTVHSPINPTTVTLQMEPPKELTSQESDVEPDDFKSTPTGRSLVNPTTVPLQQEPPKEFTPQVLDPEPDDLKPIPTAYLAELGENRATYQGEDTLKAFQRVDEYAVLVSQQQQESFKQLIWQLIYAQNITSELERVRAIFFWLCTKDLNKMNFDNVKPGSPEETLMHIHMGKSSYAEAFLTLCRYADIHCKLIQGYAKYRDYSPHTRFTGSDQEYCWNAVLIDGTWRLVDCNWAARYNFKMRTNMRELTYDLNTFYFLTDPGQFIYSHFPHDADWQLLHNPITLEEFESFAFVLSPFFKYNLRLLSYRNVVVEFTEPEIRIKVGFPRGSEKLLFFDIELKFDDKDFTEHHNSVPLIRYARHEVLEKESCLAVYVRPPKSDAYILSIYVKPTQNEVSNASDALEAADNHYEKMCEYRLMAKVSPNACLPPFPHENSGVYGQTEMARRFNINADNREPTVRAIQGTVELRFYSQDSNRPLPQLMGKLKSTLLSAEAINHCIVQRFLSHSTEFVFSIFLPDAGEYGLEVYANDPQRDGDSHIMVWRYLLTSDHASPVRGLPSLPPDYLGPSPKFAELGLSTVSHSDPFIRSATGELCVQLAYQQNLPLKWRTKLTFTTNDSSEDCSQMIRQQIHMKEIYFLLRFPRTGFYKFQIYGSPAKDRKDSLPNVYNYLIEVIRL